VFALAGYFSSSIFVHQARKTELEKQVRVKGKAQILYNSDNRLINLIMDDFSHSQGIIELEPFNLLIEEYVKQATKKYPDLHISYYFRDLDNGIWVGLNEEERFAPASLFKLPLMLAVLKEAESNPAILSATYQFFQKDFQGLDEGLDGFKKKDGEFYSLEELLRQMIVYSDNAASLILLKYIGDAKLAAVENFLSHQVPKNGQANTNFIRVKDYASIFRILYNCSYLNKDMSIKALTYLSQAQYPKGIRSAIPYNILIAHKYGIRDIELNGNKVKGYQLHHFGIVYYPGKPFIIGVMTRGKNEEISNHIIHDLSEITYREVDRQMKGAVTTHIVP
jgi:beta-lactamase class A